MANDFDNPDYDCFEESSVAVAEPEERLDLIAWDKRGRELAAADTDVKWQIGEWILEGTVIHDDNPNDPMSTLDYAQSITGLARGTLKDLASTAKRFPASVRTDDLSWSHHRVLINTRPDASDEQLKEWLDKAVEHNWAVGDLAREAKSPVGPKPKYSKSFNVTVPLDVWETLNDLSEDENSTVQEIAAQVLIGHCDQDEVKIRRDIAKKNVRKRRHDARARNGRRVARVYDNLGLNR
jgi:hypothetical protein